MMHKTQSGFTLVEMIVVLVITGIIGGIVAVFIRMPVQGYTDTARRTEMTDIADTALRRISRDIHIALPNSVSVTITGGARRAGGCTGNNTCFIEFLPMKGSGRYRAGNAGALCNGVAGNTNGDALSFTATDTCFEVLGPMPAMVAGATPDQIVVYNRGIACADAYEVNPTAPCTSTNRTAFAANPTATTVTIASKQFPFKSPGNRFQVIDTPVTYVCAPATDAAGNGTGTLTRWQGYAIQYAQPTALPSPGTGALLANRVSACSFSYDAVGLRLALVTLQLTLSDSGEKVTLYSSTHVSNVP